MHESRKQMPRPGQVLASNSTSSQVEFFIAIHRTGSRDPILQLLNFSETWSWRWLSGRLRKFNKIEAKSIGAFA